MKKKRKTGGAARAHKHADAKAKQAAPEQNFSAPPSAPVKLTPLWLAAATGLVYFFSNPKPQFHYDYTFRIAGALLRGAVGLRERPPSWLNEMVPFDGFYYSVFPLGSVLTMLPVAVLKAAGLIEQFPAAVIVGVIAGAISLFLFLLARSREVSAQRRWALVLFVMFGTWMWCNLAYGGAWQIALGFAVLGQLGALYFTLAAPMPLVAGLFFALAFGNRTEVVLLAPLFMYLLWRGSEAAPRENKTRWLAILKFCAFPFLLGAATLAYNHARFHSPFDFGYARIPGVLEEPWYRHGIFSVHSIPRNAWAMLLEPWKVLEKYPYLVPTGFGGSILISSPFLLTAFRRGARDRELKIVAWAAVTLLTLVLWLHGNPGGWQFSYRYAMILLPWLFLILLENGPRKVSAAEYVLLAFSIIANAYGTYLFLWTDYVRP